MTLTCPLATLLCNNAVARAEALGVPMVVACSDHRAELVAFVRMDGALPASSDLAIQKAYTAAALRMPTEQVGRLSREGQPLYGLQHAMTRKIAVFGGGLPLTAAGRMLGAVGVSGGTVAQDMTVADAVRETLGAMAQLQARLATILPDPGGDRDAARRFGRRLAAALTRSDSGLWPPWDATTAGAVLLHYS